MIILCMFALLALKAGFRKVFAVKRLYSPRGRLGLFGERGAGRSRVIPSKALAFCAKEQLGEGAGPGAEEVADAPRDTQRRDR